MGTAGRPVEILLERTHPDAFAPQRSHPGDAGWDLFADRTAHLKPGERALVPTGLKIALPDGFAGFVHPRSGKALREGLGIVNAPGVIDAGYRGEIKVIVINHDRSSDIVIERGDRIAQLIIQQFTSPIFVEVEELPEAARGGLGFGSSGS